MRRLSRVVATVTGVAVISLAAGCGGDNPAPSAAPSNTPSSTNTETTAPTPPRKPASISAKTRQGARAAAEHFIASLNYAGASGDTGPLRATYAASCTRCEAISKSISTTYEAGGRYEGGDWRPTAFKFYRLEGDVAVLDAVVSYTPQRWYKSSSAQPTDFKASTGNLHSFQMKFVPATGWQVGALDPSQ